MRLLVFLGFLLVAATTVAQTQRASDVADFVSIAMCFFVRKRAPASPWIASRRCFQNLLPMNGIRKPPSAIKK